MLTSAGPGLPVVWATWAGYCLRAVTGGLRGPEDLDEATSSGCSLHLAARAEDRAGVSTP